MILTRGHIAGGYDIPLKFPFPFGDLDPNLKYSSLWPPESASQAASQSVQPFCKAYCHCRQTNRPCYSIYSNRSHL